MLTKDYPLVSVIVPSYNHSRYISECLQSILDQDYPNFELIIVDDASTDNSQEIISGFAGQDSRIAFVANEKNLGLTRTLNKALKHFAKGEYIIEIASDDIFCPDRIKSQVDFMEQHPEFGFAYSRAYQIDKNSKIIGEVSLAPRTGWIFDDLFLARFNIPASTCIYRSKVFEEVGYYNQEAMVEDSDIWYKITKKYQVGFLDIFTVYYRRHETNMSRKYVEMYYDSLQRLGRYKQEPMYKKAMRQAIVKGFFNVSLSNSKEAIKILPKAVAGFNTKFFWAGILNLLGMKFLVKKIAGIR